jgi:hypothetical protein
VTITSSNTHEITSSFNRCPRAEECPWLVQGIVTFAAMNRANVPKMPPAGPVVPHASRSQPSPPPVTLVTIHWTSPWHLMFDRPAAVAMNVIDHRGCDFIGWDRLPACQKYGENDRLEAYPTISSQPLWASRWHLMRCQHVEHNELAQMGKLFRDRCYFG